MVRCCNEGLYSGCDVMLRIFIALSVKSRDKESERETDEKRDVHGWRGGRGGQNGQVAVEELYIYICPLEKCTEEREYTKSGHDVGESFHVHGMLDACVCPRLILLPYPTDRPCTPACTPLRPPPS